MRELKLFITTNWLPHSNEWEVQVILKTGPSGKGLLVAEDVISGIVYPDPDVWVADRLGGLFE